MSTPPPTATEIEEFDARATLQFAVDNYHPGIQLACSFQKEESVLLDILSQIQPNVEIFALDTDLLFKETYDLWQQLEDRYNVRIQRYSSLSLSEQEQQHEPELWKHNPAGCCQIRKVKPLKRALAGSQAWIVGIRREQSPTRANTKKIEWDHGNNLWKVSPLADWSERDIWRYIHEHDLPYNKLHDQGYASIGCIPCTQPGEGRSGRWAGNEKTECGLHGEES